MKSGYHKIFWGFVLATFHINIMGLEIIPPFIAYLFVASGLYKLEMESRNIAFRYSKYLTLIYAFLSFAENFSTTIRGASAGTGMLTILWGSLFGIVEILLYYFLFLGTVQTLQASNYMELASDYTNQMRCVLYLTMIGQAGLIIAKTFHMESFYAIIGFCLLMVRIYLMHLMNRLYKTYKVEEEDI